MSAFNNTPVSGDASPKRLSMPEFIKSMAGVQEWIDSLQLTDEIYTLSMSAKRNVQGHAVLPNQLLSFIPVMTEYKVALEKYSGGLKEEFTATFINGQKIHDTYTAEFIKAKSEMEQFHEWIVDTLNASKQDIKPDDDEEEDYYDQVWK